MEHLFLKSSRLLCSWLCDEVRHETFVMFHTKTREIRGITLRRRRPTMLNAGNECNKHSTILNTLLQKK